MTQINSALFRFSKSPPSIRLNTVHLSSQLQQWEELLRKAELLISKDQTQHHLNEAKVTHKENYHGNTLFYKMKLYVH